MIKRSSQLRHASEFALRGGEGTVEMTHMLDESEAAKTGRTFALASIPPGASIGYHQHVGDMEIYHILSGTASVRDDEVNEQLHPGDTMICYDGHWHSIANDTEEPLEYIALILYTGRA